MKVMGRGGGSTENGDKRDLFVRSLELSILGSSVTPRETLRKHLMYQVVEVSKHCSLVHYTK